MSPPIRDGSGSSIGSIRLGDGTGISEVRTGAGDVVFNRIPDSVVSRDADTRSDSPLTRKLGIEVTTTETWSKIQTKVSSFTSGFSRAFVHELNSDGTVNTKIADINVSSKTSGDVITFSESDLSEDIGPNSSYSFALDNGASSYQVGFSADNGPYTSGDGNITIEGGTDFEDADVTTTPNCHSLITVGNINF